MKDEKTHISKRGGSNKHTPMSKQAMFSKISARSDEIIDELFKLALGSKQPAVRLGALKTLINKILPDLKVTELQGNEDKPLGVVLLPRKDYGTYMESTPGTTAGSSNSD